MVPIPGRRVLYVLQRALTTRPDLFVRGPSVAQPLFSPRELHSLSADSDTPQASVKDLHEKILQAVKAKNCPPNAWIWSLIGSCTNKEDIELLFTTLERFRKFRLSSLRIYANFNQFLCQRVAEACARAGAYDYGLMTLWKHNMYGITPSIASAHYLMRQAREQNDYKLMEKVMDVLQKNSLPLQPGTADLVFSICRNANRWDLITKYSKIFIAGGVKLHRNTFDTWMEFAANRGDTSSLWQIEELRLRTIKKQSISIAFSCAKGFLLEHKPESAASVIHALNQDLPDKNKPFVEEELQKLIGDWSVEVVKCIKGDKKELFCSLKKDILLMLDALKSMGLRIVVDTGALNQENFE